MASTTGAAPTGCYKCGRTGHWGQDCKANPISSSATARPGAGGGGSWKPTGRSPAGFVPKYGARRGEGVDGKNGTANNAPAKEVRKPRKKPKLTPELLLSDEGLGYVLQKMPDMVSIKGSEDMVVEDLKSLLQGYMQWHSRLLPSSTLDQFLDQVAKLGGNQRVHRCVQELRDKIPHGKGSSVDEVLKAETNKESSSKDAEANEESPPMEAEGDGGVSSKEVPYENNSDELQRNVDDYADLNDFSEDDDPPVPMNDDDLEDLLRQGIAEESSNRQPAASTVGGGSGVPGTSPMMSPVRKFPSLAEEQGERTPRSKKATGINEEAAARMEANRLRALERRARLANNV